MGFWPLLNRGELAVLFCFVWLFVAAAGAGPASPRRRAGPVARAGGGRARLTAGPEPLSHPCAMLTL